VVDLFAPADHTVEAVTKWLVESGIPKERFSQSTNKAWLQFDASIEEMELLLDTKYHYYEHAAGGRPHIGCDDYKVPKAVSGHIDYVTPGVKFMAMRDTPGMEKRDLVAPIRRPISRPMPADLLAKIKQNPGKYTRPKPAPFVVISNAESDTEATSDCGSTITPACIKAMYGITAGTTKTAGNTLGIYELGDIYAQQDLNSFFKTYAR
jgi:tripeptidyl-peptidase-1